MDNQSLTRRPVGTVAKRARRERSSGDMLGMVRRTARAMVRRAEAGDLEALEALRSMGELVRAAELDAGRALNANGVTHADIASFLGISKQAAAKRYGQG